MASRPAGISLVQMGVTSDAAAKMMAVAEAAAAAGETVHNMPFKVTPRGVQAAIPDGGSAGRRLARSVIGYR